jgi:hypothetical protein
MLTTDAAASTPILYHHEKLKFYLILSPSYSCIKEVEIYKIAYSERKES